MDINPCCSGFEAGPLAESLSQHTPVPIPYKAPIDWGRWLTVAAVGTLFAITLRFISPIMKSRWTWAAGTVVTILVMTAGHMFTRIRGAPNNGPNGQWIAAGYQNQFGQETQVVAMICTSLRPSRGEIILTSLFIDGLLGSAVLMLTVVTPYTASPRRQRAQVYLWSFVIFIMYSVLVSLFRVKNRGTNLSSAVRQKANTLVSRLPLQVAPVV